MTGRKNLVAVDSDAIAAPETGMGAIPETGTGEGTSMSEPAPMEETLFAEHDPAEDADTGAPWLPIAAGVAAIAGWSAFFIWANLAQMGAAPPARWAEWIVQWSVPVLLVIGVWLIAMRSSTREAARFGDVAHVLSRESQLLEHRLTIINRELSMARDFIAAQSRDLEALGRVAAERLSQNADRLQGLIRDNGEQVETIGHVSSTAVENMDRLRDGLPVISNSARDVASQIGRAGDTAEERLNGLIAGFERLNEFGEASGRAVDDVRAKVSGAVSAFESQARQMEEIAEARFGELAERSAMFRAELDGREVEAFAAIRRRADALSEELNQRSDEFLLAQEGAIDDLRGRMAMLRADGDALVGALRHGHGEMADKVSAAIAALEQRMADAIAHVSEIEEGAVDGARARIATLNAEVRGVDDTIAGRLAALDVQLERRRQDAGEREARELAAMEQRMGQFDQQLTARQEEQLAHVEQLAERGETLARRLETLGTHLENLSVQGQDMGSGITLTAGELGRKLDEGRSLLVESEDRVTRLTDASLRLLDIIRSGTEQTGTQLPQAIARAQGELAAIEDRAQTLAALVGQTGDRGAALTGHVQSASAESVATLEKLDDIERRLTDLAARSRELASDARGQLDDAMAALERASTQVLERMRDGHTATVRDIAERIGRESGGTIDRVLREQAAAAIAELREAAETAGQQGRDTAAELRRQMEQVNELAGNLEHRVAEARASAEEQVDNEFSRRMALITEALNSTTIDITKAFDNEVTDTAWASYLRGDRGIFTRRAVRLLDNQDQRAIADIYDADGDFRETVNRYIQDFEAMLRSILSTRDGNTIAVTLLSSDMGKLYVALAQAIDRLRR